MAFWRVVFRSIAKKGRRKKGGDFSLNLEILPRRRAEQGRERKRKKKRREKKKGVRPRFAVRKGGKGRKKKMEDSLALLDSGLRVEGKGEKKENTFYRHPLQTEGKRGK